MKSSCRHTRPTPNCTDDAKANCPAITRVPIHLRAILIGSAIALGLFSASFSFARDAGECRTIASDSDRLECYDRAFPPPSGGGASNDSAQSANEIDGWQTQALKSESGSVTSVLLIRQSDESVGKYFHARGPVELGVMCSADETDIAFKWPMSLGDGEIVARIKIDAGDWREVTFKIDDGTSVARLGSSQPSLELIKSLRGASTMVLSLTPPDEPLTSATFKMTELKQALRPFSSICKLGWWSRIF